MTTLTREATPVKPATNPRRDPDDETWCPGCCNSDPASWPSWVDDDVWTLTDPGPDPADLEWAAVEFNADDDIDEHAAAEAAALDALEAGMLDLGRGPLRGIGDELARDYATDR